MGKECVLDYTLDQRSTHRQHMVSANRDRANFSRNFAPPHGIPQRPIPQFTVCRDKASALLVLLLIVSSIALSIRLREARPANPRF
jgi:hypothetical protein